MRSLVLLIACFSLLGKIAFAAKPLTITRAPQRWSDAGKGGSPEYIRHIVPLFSKLGCNNRACHGSFQGQSGFRLSLFGFEPDEDLKELFEEDDDGVRTSPDAPDKSFVLFKPTHEDEHDGGERMTVGSWQHRMFRHWIAGGGKYEPDKVARVTRFEVQPSEFVADSLDQKVSLKAIAYFSDNTVEDVTGLTVFSSNDESIATVSDDGKVTVARPGCTAIVVRYSGSVTSTQVLVPAPSNGKPYPLTFPHNKIDEFADAKLRKLNIHPSVLSSDSDFIRRTYLDVIGMLPTADETREFLDDRSPDKRATLIDRLHGRGRSRGNVGLSAIA